MSYGIDAYEVVCQVHLDIDICSGVMSVMIYFMSSVFGCVPAEASRLSRCSRGLSCTSERFSAVRLLLPREFAKYAVSGDNTRR